MADKKKWAKTPVMCTPIGIFSNLWAYKPHDEESGVPYPDNKFKSIIVLPSAKQDDLKPLKAAMFKAAKEQFGPDVKWKNLETPFKDGNEKYEAIVESYDKKVKEGTLKKDDAAKKKANWEFFKDAVYFQAKTKKKPGIVGPDRKPLPEGEDLAAGDYGLMSVVGSTYERTVEIIEDGKKKKIKIQGVLLYLQNLQKVKTGKRFTSQSDPTADFGEVDVEALNLPSVEVSDDESFDETDDTKSDKKESKAEPESAGDDFE